jgi:hypothetical protein
MSKKSAASYLDSIGSGRDAVNVDGPQVGKDHQEEVAAADNWKDDQRDTIGRAASMQKKKLARKLRRIAAELECLDDEYKDEVEDMSKDLEEKDADYLTKSEKQDDEKDTTAEEKLDPMDMEMGTDSAFDEITSDISTDNHPIEKDVSKMDPEANASSQKGDEEWIEIGPGTFDDKRDINHRAA